jgi:hypothetical protein
MNLQYPKGGLSMKAITHRFTDYYDLFNSIKEVIIEIGAVAGFCIISILLAILANNITYGP